MKSKIKNLVLVVLVIFGIMALLIGCSSSTTPVNILVVESSVDPIVTNILTSLNNNDYTGFAQNFDQTMKNTINQATVSKLYSQMQTTVGDYQSDVFFSAANKGSSVTVVYLAQYSNEPADVTATLTVQVINGTYQVQGLIFNSPNLAGAPINVSQVRAYADSETENVLMSLNKNDYDGFSKDFNQTMKNAIPQASFTTLYNQMTSTVGDYQSKEFEIVSTENNIITVEYYAKYTLEPAGVWVSISFDSNQKISGLYFNSPKLQQSQSK
jgi:hypothetical protein